MRGVGDAVGPDRPIAVVHARSAADADAAAAVVRQALAVVDEPAPAPRSPLLGRFVSAAGIPARSRSSVRKPRRLQTCHRTTSATFRTTNRREVRHVRRPGAHEHQMKALRNLQEEGIPFRFNTVLSTPALPQIGDIARLAARTGAEVVNFLGFNPFNDQETGKRSAENVPRYSELGPPLDEALDILAEAGVEANVRYLPFCVVAPRHRGSVYDFPQISYDHHENDFASWSWTDLPAQRTRDAALTPPFLLGPRLRLGPLRGPLRRLAARLPRVGAGLHEIKQRLELTWAERETTTLEARYQEDARMRAREYTGYRHVAACASCDLEPVCDGLYADYMKLFGPDEARPIDAGGRVTDPQHFSRHQAKKINPTPEDERDFKSGAAFDLPPLYRASRQLLAP